MPGITTYPYYPESHTQPSEQLDDFFTIHQKSRKHSPLINPLQADTISTYDDEEERLKSLNQISAVSTASTPVLTPPHSIEASTQTAQKRLDTVMANLDTEISESFREARMTATDLQLITHMTISKSMKINYALYGDKKALENFIKKREKFSKVLSATSNICIIVTSVLVGSSAAMFFFTGGLSGIITNVPIVAVSALKGIVDLSNNVVRMTLDEKQGKIKFLDLMRKLESQQQRLLLSQNSEISSRAGNLLKLHKNLVENKSKTIIALNN